MKLYTILAALLLCCSAYSQNYVPTERRVVAKPTNQSLYLLEYELKHFVFENGDSTILNTINFELLPAQREQSVDVEVFDASIGQIIILYSYDKMQSKYLEKSGQR